MEYAKDTNLFMLLIFQMAVFFFLTNLIHELPYREKCSITIHAYSTNWSNQVPSHFFSLVFALAKSIGSSFAILYTAGDKLL